MKNCDIFSHNYFRKRYLNAKGSPDPFPDITTGSCFIVCDKSVLFLFAFRINVFHILQTLIFFKIFYNLQIYIGSSNALMTGSEDTKK